MKNKAKILSRLIMEKLFAVAGDDKVDLKKRKKAVVTLLEAVAKGLYKDNVKDVPIDFEQVKLLAEKLDVPVIIYAGDTYIKHVCPIQVFYIYFYNSHLIELDKNIVLSLLSN